MDRLDWNQLRAFLETADSGSLSAAARKMGLTQPTLSRQVAAIEERLGVTLFERLGKSMVLTATGVDLLEHARNMGSAAEDLALAATGRSQAVEGIVTISASDAVAAYLLPPAIKKIRDVAPGVVIEVVTSNALSDLRRREADIACRHVSPTEPDLIARLLREATASFYASTEWVTANGHPRTPDHARPHHFVGADRTGRFLDYLRAHGLPLTTGNFPIYSDSSLTAWSLVRHGLGIGVMMDDIARLTDGVVRVLDEVPPVRFPFWLVTHRELRTSRRIRVVFDVLADCLDVKPPQS